MIRHLSPLRYPGGKAQLKGYIKKVIELNDLDGCCYIEPFAGGAGLALKLLDEGIASRIILNDLDWDVWNFWDVTLHNTDEMVRLIETTRVTIQEFIQAREVLQTKLNKIDKAGKLERAFAFFFLNRTCTSGIINAGPIGGMQQTGNYKIDARFNPEGLVKRFERIKELRSRIELNNDDFFDFFPSVIDRIIAEKHLIYCDPPYYNKADRLYLNVFVHKHHQALHDLLCRYPDVNWCVSYDNVGEIRNIFRVWKQREYNLSYSANEHRTAKERMFFSPKLHPSVTQKATA